MTITEKRRGVLLVRDDLARAIAAAEAAGVSTRDLTVLDRALELVWSALSESPSKDTELAATRLLVAVRDRLGSLLR